MTPINEDLLRRASRITFLGTISNFAFLTLQLLVITPLVIRIAGAEINGAWVGAGDILIWLQAFDFGLTNFTVQRMSAAWVHNQVRSIASWFGITVAILIVISVTIILLGNLLLPLIFKPFTLAPEQIGDLQAAFRLGLMAVALTLLSYPAVGLARAVHQPQVVILFTNVGSLASISVTWWTLIHGAGIRAVAFGMLARAVLAVLGGLISTIIIGRQIGMPLWNLQRADLSESLRIMPLSGLGTLGYAVTNQSDNYLVGSFFGAATATDFNVTKRISDVIKSLIETLGYANFAAFAHRYAAGGIHEARAPYQRLMTIHSLLILGLGGGYLVINNSFIGLWVGGKFDLGPLITFLVTVQVFTITRSYLVNTIYRAMYEPQYGFVVQVLEASAKMTLAVILGRVVGLEGLLGITIIVTLVGGLYISRRIDLSLETQETSWMWSMLCIFIIALINVFSQVGGLFTWLLLTTLVFVWKYKTVLR